uniref:Protein OSCP1 n=1 Tax=Ceratitis capitata TaxID=7213 RepID=W8B368_CERCA
MASLSRQCNPRANVFLMVNLGCEMLYVIDQRLKAQQICDEKSTQVIHDVTVVLLEPKFIDSLIVGSTHKNSQLLTVDHCKFMLNDIATSSIMRLDKSSMDKLWNLMTMIYKWQLFNSKHPQHLLDITFRHLDAISQLRPDAKRTMLVDFTKNVLLDFWNDLTEDTQWGVYHTNKAWLQCFNTKISLLIRLGFQTLDGHFVRALEASYYKEFVDTIGENVYAKSVEVAEHQQRHDSAGATRQRVGQLAELLNFSQTDSEELQPIDANSFQKQFEQNLQQCNILFFDLDVNETSTTNTTNTTTTTSENKHAQKGENETDNSEEGKGNGDGNGDGAKANPVGSAQILPDSSSTTLATKRRAQGEFVQLPAVYSRNADGGRAGALSLNRDLLDLYSKIL